MAMAAKLTVVQTRHVVALGDIPPANVHTPGVFVHRVVHVPGEASVKETAMTFRPLDRAGIAARIARDIPEGWFVNLGIGIPTGVSDHVPHDREVIFHSENGVIGAGPAPAPGQDQSVPGQCRHAAHHAAHRRIVRPSRRQLRHRSGRPSGSLRAGRVRGGGERRHRQLGACGRRADKAGRWRHGPGDRCETFVGGDGAHHQEPRRLPHPAACAPIR